MKIIRNIKNLKFQTSPCILTIGNFDGMHLGHQKLLTLICNKKKEENKPITIILFEPQPKEFFHSDNPPVRLMKFREKIKYLSKWGIDTILCIYFNYYFSLIDPLDFIKKIIVEKLNTCFLFVGKNFVFGAQRKGNISLLQNIGKLYNFKVHVENIFAIQGTKISSTAIRKALQNDNLELAKTLLGRSFSISGKVTYGKQYGTKITGFPTANIILYNDISPVHGVFIIKTFIYSLKKTFFGVANVGHQPSMYGTQNKLEVHLINISINLYREYIKVTFIKKIRNEMLFTSLKDLKTRIENDVNIAILYLKKHFDITL